LLDSLDCPSPSVAAPTRRNTTTPLQALSLMNDSFVQRQAIRCAQRARAISGEDLEAQVSNAYMLALGRRPNENERLAMVRLSKDQKLESVCWVLLNASEFMYVR